MNYSVIKPVDVANGPGVRVSLFVSGCRNHCKGCFQPETWDFGFGKPYTDETTDTILNYLKPAYIEGLTILGGDPMEPENIDSVCQLCQKVKEVYPNKSIWVYTGYTLQYLWSTKAGQNRHILLTLLHNIDVLVDGPFIEEQKNLALNFRGSENQRIIDIPRTLKSNEIVYHPQQYLDAKMPVRD